MEINHPTYGQGVEPSGQPQLEHQNTVANEQNSMERLLGEEGLSIEFPQAGEIRLGVIATIKENEILVSIGTKSEGVISGKELESIPKEKKESFKVGSEIPVYVVNPEDENGNVVLSFMRAIEQRDWQHVTDLLASGDVIESKVVGYNKGGLLVPIGSLRGFVPASQIGLARRATISGNTPEERWGKMVGEEIIVRVIEVDQERHRLILSERLALQESRDSLKDRLLEGIKEGDIRTGRVTSVADFGAFVNIDGADGLVHLSEVSWDRITHPRDVLKVGDEVKVKVISIDRERKRIGLSIRQLQEDPWMQKVAHLREGQLIEGTITHLTKFGAFARISEDLEGLVHLSEISEEHINHPKEKLKEGEVVTLRIIKIDPEKRRIGLSLKKVDSPAYADLDWKIALAEEVQEVSQESAQAEQRSTVAEETVVENNEAIQEETSSSEQLNSSASSSSKSAEEQSAQ